MMSTLILMLAALTARADASCEVWDLPEKGLVRLEVPREAAGDGELQVFANGTPLAAQEIPGAGCCVVNPDAEMRTRSRGESIGVTFRRRSGQAATGTRLPRLAVSNAAFSVVFDEKRNGGLPSEIAWASGKRADHVGWGDRIYGNGIVGRLSGCRTAEIRDFGRGPVFRHIRTTAWFEDGKGRCAGSPKAVYDWLFLNDAPEWVMVRMRFETEGRTVWKELHSGQIEFPFSAFTDSAVAIGDGKVNVRKLPRNGKDDRATGKILVALFSGRDFAAVAGPSVCAYTYPGCKIDYLHASYGASYSANWEGEPLTRTAFFRFGSADSPARALAEPTPVGVARGSCRPVDIAAAERMGPGERPVEVRADGLRVLTAIVGGKSADIRSVRTGDGVLAVGPQRLFSIAVEGVESGKRIQLTSRDEWESVTAGEKDGSTYWRFSGPCGRPELRSLTVTVKATPAGPAGIDWSFAGRTGTSDYALDKAAVGELDLFCTGRGMRAVWPGCMGELERTPCDDGTQRSGRYPSMGCVMPWEAVWDETSGRCFMMAALDPAGGVKNVDLRGSSADASVRMSLEHLLSWDGRDPGAVSRMSGVIAWRAFAGDWYDAALRYRDWVRENAVWHPKMGPDGRRSTPQWFKDLGYILKTYGAAKKTEDDLALCREFLGVPVMAHWYHWFPGIFDNDYPHYYPPNPDVPDGVRRIHAAGGRAVPYTNGHIWDTHDRGAEDWKFTRYGAAGACRRPDGSIVTERYATVETNGQPVVFAAMCPASRTWRGKVVENAGHVVNDCGFDGYYMDQVGAFANCVCRNVEHGHPFGAGSWWQDATRRMLKDVRAACDKPVFLATEGNSECNLDQIDACVCWHIPGGVDTVPAFEVCYSGAVTVYCRAPRGPTTEAREMRMKLANTLVDGDMFGWMPVVYCQAKAINGYFRTCIRFRHANVEWFTTGEMRRPPRLTDPVPEWNETWSMFNQRRQTRMPIVQTAARRILDYDYDRDGNRLWRTGRVRKAFVYFTNFSPNESARSRVGFDFADLGVDIGRAEIVRIDAEGGRTPFPREDLDKPFDFPPDSCFGLEFKEVK